MAEDPQKREGEYLYRSSGIRERQGQIPLWLKLVVALLFLWSVCYLVRFWSAD
jgi:hypothetical protein